MLFLQKSPLRNSFIRLLGVCLLLVLGAAAGWAQSGGELIDRTIAVVGSEVILESEVYQNAQSIALQQGLNPVREPEKFEELKKSVLAEMVNQKVLLAKAREDTIMVEAREVDRELENRLALMIQNAGSEEKIEELYGYPIHRIRREFRSVVEEGLLVEKIKQARLRDVKVTRGEVEQYFKDNPGGFPQMKDALELAHILREVGSGSAETRARARADSMYSAIKDGASFDSLAGTLSDDATAARKQGKIGWTEKGDLLSEYESAAEALTVGEISRPVRTRAGFHIIRLEDRAENRILTSHILVKPVIREEDEQSVQDTLAVIREEILAGMPFEEAAKTYSQDLESAGRGGYLGWFALEEMPDFLRAPVDTLETGEISQPFSTQYGWHLVQLKSRHAARDVSLDQDWELISQRALNAKREAEYRRWLEGLKERYYIEVKG
ncbi:MAG: hypothetical protein C4524_07300 [Candidatus Zixiibacteriota bacterium]|nr:MAG: hypothetical protein C4524_07300 [candidate division Zixibacteria bacterium]